ncbi:50S ribosomal protein L28 [Rhodospirillum rubrum]|uniref:Large ribosomal subunit protein bL28 n=2 Tax=Rhodospirillum rubrum TaxID=1085 RepID=RL28_RHORT|nr:50S ribosomal protein L28 [Rhodospirillum rubrum]Q2RXY0.1 RecName: Full=Large ribosomal subunit protein bL28; AltName: Full=50S ribosomal protein L28 [Rhodospirillum rubrum ATCC 11170]ABC21015.1 LSU ribosomal protein L28P [Rhodospirillum rubrum ATCC 11170]AEO46681.1 50S ribosomal protein L28 [Rhodospirillum rubrum F11]MBK5952557.1 50S ribosomal protein L28 [Rhodospirillum rubrum]QXG80711.1 50S ribosomal protein L28 [Rhodospirillum rubrum]HCF18217.1 50S ribosomal protein L28 [Rhodospirillum
MSRRCAVTGKGVQTGNNVSHSNIKSRRRFLPNLQVNSLMSDLLREPVRMRLSAHGLRTVEHRGGIDAFLLSTPSVELTVELRKVKRRMVKIRDAAAAAA